MRASSKWIFRSDRFRKNFITTLKRLRTRWGFKIVGYVLMPEHFHLFIQPSEEADPSRIMQSLKEGTAKFIVKNLQENAHLPFYI